MYNTTEQQKLVSIEQYILNSSRPFSEWYCGIACSPEERLFNDHAVNRQTDAWIYRTFPTETAARDTERYFHSKGCRGDVGGGDCTTTAVYAYLIGRHTRE